jgi:hypothetical protein
MRNLPVPALPFAVQRQLDMPLDPGRLQRLSPSERRTLVSSLASLLTEAAGIRTGERDDDER